MTTDAIAIVIESLGGGGAQHVATTLANAWAAQGRLVTVITFRDQTSDIFQLDRDVRRIVVGKAEPSRSLYAAILGNITRLYLLRSALKKSRSTVVFGFIGTTNILTILATIGLGLRIVISERNDPERQSLGRYWDVFRRLTYQYATLVSANSRSALDTMAAYVPRERLVFLPNPLRIEPEIGATPFDCRFFLSVGRLEPQKAHDVLLEAFARFCMSHPGWRLVFLGDGPLLDILTKRAAEPDLADRVHFRGYEPNPFPWYRAAAALVHPALFEGLPNAVIEAMGEGRPVIVSDAQTGLRDYVQDGKNALVVPVASIDALHDAMLALANDSELSRRLGQAARDSVAIFRADRVVAEWTSLLFQATRRGDSNGG
jgi:GalNAc-alpha-(1->4)-GalNAc-alpha-(1->3)-diNAcBac-PP-undecaprenol alpha-1,4-N-acetyl-D-galactosaminyltransferase